MLNELIEKNQKVSISYSGGSNERVISAIITDFNPNLGLLKIKREDDREAIINLSAVIRIELDLKNTSPMKFI